MTKNEYLQNGFNYFAKEQFSEAAKEFEQALKIDPQFDLALNALAQVYNKLGEIEKAIEIVQRQIAIHPDDPIAHTALSRLYIQKGKIKEAEEELAISNRLASRL